MIKYFKYFLTLFVISLGILNFSYGRTSYGVNGSTVSCNLYLDDVGEINGFTDGYNVNVTNLGNLWTYSDLGNTNIFYIYSNNNRRMWAWIDGKLYHNSYSYYSTIQPASKLQGFIDKVKVVPSSCLDDYSCVSKFNNYSEGTVINASEFYDMDLTFTKYGVFATNGQSNNCSVNPSYIFGGLVFLASDGNFYSVACQGGRDYPQYCPSGIITGSSVDLNSDLLYESLSSYIYSTSPFGSSSNNKGPISYTGTFEDEIDSTIAYYEYRYNWNENMCYVGTNDLEHSFRYFIGQGVSYEYGSGATLYQLYYNIYSGFGNNKIRNLGSFINSWVINYGMVYDTLGEDDIRYVARYNGPDTNVTILYTGYTNELFLGNLGAIYNMASVLYNSYMQESTMGEEVAYYCDIKLNYQNYKNGTLSFTGLQDLVTPGIIERVGDYISRDMPGSTGYIQPDMGSGSIWNDIVSSGYAIPEDINPTNLFKDYYDKMNNLVRNFVPASGTGIIPDWILFPMLFLIFYRIIRH